MSSLFQMSAFLAVFLLTSTTVAAGSAGHYTKSSIRCSTEYCPVYSYGNVPRTTTTITVDRTKTSFTTVTPTTTVSGVDGTITATIIQTVDGAITLDPSTTVESTFTIATENETRTTTTTLTAIADGITTSTSTVVTTLYPSCINTTNARVAATPAAAGRVGAAKPSFEPLAARDEVDDTRGHRYPKSVYCTLIVTRLTTVYSTATAPPVTIYGSSVVSTVTELSTITTNENTVTPAPLTRTTTFLATVTSTSEFTVTTATTLSYVFTYVVTTTSTVVIGTTGTPNVFLPSPTAIIGNVVNGSPQNYDDYTFAVDLPFPVTFYGVSNSTIMVSINGHFSVDGIIPDGGFSSYTETPFPYASTGFPDNSVCPFWDDLYLFAGTPQGIYYEIDGVGPQRNLTIEWYTSHYQDSAQYYHFTALYQEAVPNVVQFTYLDISDNGVSAAVGAQSITTNQYTQYSFDQPIIYPGLQLTYDTATNTFVTGGVVPCVSD